MSGLCVFRAGPLPADLYGVAFGDDTMEIAGCTPSWTRPKPSCSRNTEPFLTPHLPDREEIKVIRMEAIVVSGMTISMLCFQSQTLGLRCLRPELGLVGRREFDNVAGSKLMNTATALKALGTTTAPHFVLAVYRIEGRPREQQACGAAQSNPKPQDLEHEHLRIP
jgi:hypothetical protein